MFVDRRHQRRIVMLSGLSAALAFMSAAFTLTHIEIYDGVIGPELLLGSLGFDAVSLVCAVGVMLCLVAIERGALRAWLPWVGLQAYLMYAYALYAFGLVLTPLYALYLAVVGLSVFAFASFARSVHPGLLARLDAKSLPRKTMSVTLFVIAAGFAGVWIFLLSSAVVGDVSLPAATVIVLDLTLALPFLAMVGVMLWRGRPMGFLLAPGVFAMSSAITIGVAAAEFVRPLLGGGFAARQAVPYLAPGVLCLVFAIIAFRRIAPAMTAARQGG